jgi:ribonuclease BN (tRNA processing enzyme)
MEVVLLGTKGGPRLSTDRIGPSQLIRHDGRVVLVDAGEGVVHQLLRIDTRVTDEGRVDLRKLVRVVELDGTQAPFAVAGLTARAAAVAHAPVEPALAYRFDSVGGRSVVVSGDTGPCDALVELARDADVLVHEVIHPEYVVPQEPSEVNTDWELLRRHLLSSHTSVHDLGGLAARAGVGTLVLSHLVPAGRVSDEDWLGPVRQTFGGQTVVGRDLMVVTAG